VEISRATPPRYEKSISRSGTRQPPGPSICESADVNVKLSVFGGEGRVGAERAPRGLERGDAVSLG